MARPPEPPEKPRVAKSGLDHLNRQKLRRVRNLIPKEALEGERKALEYGSQQSLI